MQLLGACFSSRPYFIVLEHMALGDLKGYLTSHVGTIVVKELVRMGKETAAAMVYLAKVKYVHRDIAARNILVGADKTLKLADFG